MAGDPLAGGGFAVVNGLRVDDDGHNAAGSPTPEATCFRSPPAGRFTCATLSVPWWTSSSTAACSAGFRTTTGN
jgi:hypothetical protein